jgi:hypothetical protein
VTWHCRSSRRLKASCSTAESSLARFTASFSDARLAFSLSSNPRFRAARRSCSACQTDFCASASERIPDCRAAACRPRACQPSMEPTSATRLSKTV